jgi:hypothetical protein
MIGLGFAANQITRRTLVACGVDKKTAKWIGRGVGWTTSLISLDASGFFDVPDLPDAPDGASGGLPDYGDSDSPRRHWQ